MFVKLVQNYVRIDILAKFDHDTDTFLVCLITDVYDAVDFFIFMKFCDLFDQLCFIDKVWQFGDHNAVFAAIHWFDLRNGTDPDLASAGPVSFFDAFSSQDRCSGRKIRSFDDLHDIFDRRLIALGLVINDLYDRVDQFSQIVRRDIGCHTDCNTRCSVCQKVWIPGRQDGRFFLCFVKVRDKVYGVFIDIRQHLHCDL